MTGLTIYTVGHSTRSSSEFLALLRAHGIRRIVDVRTIPRSRHNPQFDRDRLSRSLRAAGIHYRHLPGLGGLRRPRRDSINVAWRNANFRGFADYMQTSQFQVSLDRLLHLARGETTAVMCAEAVPWRCHRSLIADALLVRGVAVQEAASPSKTEPHKPTPWARVQGTQVTYPATSVVERASSRRGGAGRRAVNRGRTKGSSGLSRRPRVRRPGDDGR
ncbi:MAG: DUF488 domain-containing protein [Euryarchaeota archaeon]|nr:DUF488 domain-containing protein [Euryarchaeota archaeon]